MITDGDADDHDELESVANQWAESVDEIYALGFANVKLEGK